MDQKRRITAFLRRGILILDGAIGKELQQAGMPIGVCPEDWCLKNPYVLRDIHAAFGRAGSRVVYSATFGANRFKLGQYGLDEVRGINRDLALLARPASPA